MKRAGLSDLRHLMRHYSWYRNRAELWGSILRGYRPRRAVLRNGVTMLAPSNSNLLGLVREIFIERLYVQEGLTLPATGVIVDIGANIGTFSVFAASQSRAKVYAFEPHPDNVRYIQRNAALNEFDTIQVHQCGVDGEEGSFHLVESRLSGGHFLTKDAEEADAHTTVEVPVTTFQRLWETHGWERVDFLKMDCEGPEGAILKATPDELWRRVDRITMEFHDNRSVLSHNQILSFLKALDYQTALDWDGESPFGHIYGWR